MIITNTIFIFYSIDITTNRSTDIWGHKRTDKRDSDAIGTMGQIGHCSHGIAKAMGQGRRLRRRQRKDSLHV